MKSLLVKIATWMLAHHKKWLESILKTIGVSGVLGISVGAFTSAFNEGMEKLGVFARLLQIDDVIDTINSGFGSKLNDVMNVDFSTLCSALGIITAINEILNSIGWCLIVFVFLLVLRLFVFILSAIKLK